MKTLLHRPNSVVIATVLLCLPMTVLVAMMALGLEPSIDPLRRLLGLPASQPDVFGSAVFIGMFLLLPLAFVAVSVPISNSLRLGRGLQVHPVNLLLAVLILAGILAILGGFVADQVPCWIGVPNCD